MPKKPIVDQTTFDKLCQCLIDNGIDEDEADTVAQAVCYIVCDEETDQFFHS